GSDCDDSLGGVYPGAVEIVDGIDNDCNSQVDDISSSGTDADGDGFDDALIGATGQIWLLHTVEP
ncbi:MAG: putative metal-binding motif-containing protein, partial [Myxococcota bacterium]